MHTMKLDTLLHQTHIKIQRPDMCTSMISLSKRCGRITYSAKETTQQNERWGLGDRQQGGGRGGQNLKKEGGYRTGSL